MDTQEKLVELLGDAKICMLTTMDKTGEHISRPMGMQQVEFDGDLWFFTYSDSRKVQHISINPAVNVAVSNGSTWISISGQAQQISDMKKAEELWNPVLKAWFPDGLETAGLTLLRVSAQGAEYWDTPGSKIATSISLIKSSVAGKPASPGDNERVQLK